MGMDWLELTRQLAIVGGRPTVAVEHIDDQRGGPGKLLAPKPSPLKGWKYSRNADPQTSPSMSARSSAARSSTPCWRSPSHSSQSVLIQTGPRLPDLLGVGLVACAAMPIGFLWSRTPTSR
jgi:hypothetical protein